MEQLEKRQGEFLNIFQMVMADGIAHPNEMAMLYEIGQNYYNLNTEQISQCISQGGTQLSIPSRPEDRLAQLYQMAKIAWADGKIEESERDLLKRYANLYGVAEEHINELVDFLLDYAKKPETFEKLINDLKQ